jgi:hypothetical protein
VTALLAGTAITLLAALGMAAAHLLGGRELWHYLLGGTALVAAAGAWLASAGSAMATAVDPTQAFWRGLLVGGGLGLFASLVLVGCWTLLRRAAARESR